MGKKRILVVEDEYVIAREIQLGLRELGYTVVDIATSGEESIEKTGEHSPDLVLMDIVLMDIVLKGEMDGIEAAKEIRSRYDVPVVYLTAYPDENTMERAKTSEPYGYLIKPFEERELHTTIEMALYRHDAEREKARLYRELQQKHEELRQKNQELEHFAYIVSHDLREPLRMVTNYTKLIEKRYRDKLDAEGEQFISYAVDGSRRMQQLLNGLLAYCRVSTHGEPFQPVDCDALLRSVVGMLDITVQEASARVTWSEMTQVVADESQLLQLFQNLIANAIKYRRDEPPYIHISVEERNNEWLFAFQDNGIGIEPQYQERVFHIFQRLHTKDKFDGTGVGLAVCRRIVERHGGQIWLESEPGRGTTFYFTISKALYNKE
ncbi:MAG: sensor histidine kinase [Chloroflexota bacterium]